MQEANRVAETATTTGTGSLTLAGALTKRQSFATAFGSGGNTEVHYTVEHDDADEWEVGIGTYLGATNQLQRDLILTSSAGGSPVNFTAGSKTIYVTRVANMTHVMRCRRPDDVALELRAAAGQSGYLLAAYNSAGSPAFKINASGGINFGSRTVSNPSDIHKHIALWGDDYGISISPNRLNVVALGRISLYAGGTVGSGTPPAEVTATGLTAGDLEAGQVRVGDGVGTPGLSFISQPDMGVSRWTSATMALVVAGQVRAWLSDSQFRVPTGVAFNAVDGVQANSIGIGTAINNVLHSSDALYLAASGGNNISFKINGPSGANVATIIADDTDAGGPLTVMTRRKADARYAAISSLRYKDDVETAWRVPGLLDVDVKRWAWGGSLAAKDFRRGKAGYGLVVEDLAPIFPEAVEIDDEGRPDRLNINALAAALLAEIQHLSARVDAIDAA